MLVDAELTRVIYDGAALLPRAWRAIDRCRTEPDPRGDLAVECGALVNSFVRLADDAADLAPSVVRSRVIELLNCQLEIVSAAAKLAFCQHGPAWPALAARFGDGRGPLSEELLQMAIDISMTGAVSVLA